MRRALCLALWPALWAGLLAVPGLPSGTVSAGPSSDPNAGVPRTRWGAPDLQGVWSFLVSTPLEAPGEPTDEAALRDREAHPDWRNLQGPSEGDPGTYNRGTWTDLPHEQERGSLVVDPPDGRVPPLMPDALVQVGTIYADIPGERPVRFRSAGIGTDGPEDRGLAERCILGFNSGPPMIPVGYNDTMQVFQNRDHVVILNEMVHDARIIPLDGRPHLPENMRQWMGDSRGHWEGDTLVVDSTNFTDKTASFHPSPFSVLGTGLTLHLTERFTRVDADTLRYEYTIDDPVTFTRPFTVRFPMTIAEGGIYEFACHEGNRGLKNILEGARAVERASAGSAAR